MDSEWYNLIWQLDTGDVNDRVRGYLERALLACDDPGASLAS